MMWRAVTIHEIVRGQGPYQKNHLDEVCIDMNFSLDLCRSLR